jgi:hypothetical protein
MRFDQRVGLRCLQRAQFFREFRIQRPDGGLALGRGAVEFFLGIGISQVPDALGRDLAQGEIGQALLAGHDGTIAGLTIGVVHAEGTHRMTAQRAAALGDHLELVFIMEMRQRHRLRALLDTEGLRQGEHALAL